MCVLYVYLIVSVYMYSLCINNTTTPERPLSPSTRWPHVACQQLSRSLPPWDERLLLGLRGCVMTVMTVMASCCVLPWGWAPSQSNHANFGILNCKSQLERAKLQIQTVSVLHWTTTKCCAKNNTKSFKSIEPQPKLRLKASMSINHVYVHLLSRPVEQN